MLLLIDRVTYVHMYNIPGHIFIVKLVVLRQKHFPSLQHSPGLHSGLQISDESFGLLPVANVNN